MARNKKIKYKSRFSSPLVSLMVCAGLMLLSGCELTHNQLKMDRAANMSVQDFRDGLQPRIEEEQAASRELAQKREAAIPSLQSYIAETPEAYEAMPLVSISVNQTVPLRDALFELANQAGYDIELDPQIRGSVIFTARNKPFDVVIARLSDIAGLRYKFEDQILRVELDTPYNKTYKIDYLSYIRTNEGSIRNDVAVVSGEGTNTGSQFQASSQSEADFWGELSTNLTQILGVKRTSLRTANDPRITASAPNPAPVEPVVAQGEGSEGITVAPPQATLQVSSLPVDSLDSGSAADGDEEESFRFSVNKQAGLVNVYASERQHKEVQEYLKLLKRSVTAQVLIEAKVMEVSLTDEFASGIDWSVLNLFSGEGSFGIDLTGASINPPLSPVPSPAVNPFAMYTGNDFNLAIEAISRFGTVRALASPRLTVLNNQSAVLNVASNQVYFEIDIDVTTDEGVTQTDIESEIRNVPEGVLINVQPSINLDDRTVSMALRPTVTRIVDFVEDPSVQFVTAEADIEGVSSQIPVVNVQEMDSVVQMDSGEALILGGLMQDRTESTETGVPVLSEVPLFGSLFKTKQDEVSKTELVVFLRATIIEKNKDTIFDIDRDLYKKFSGDRRALDL